MSVADEVEKDLLELLQRGPDEELVFVSNEKNERFKTAKEWSSAASAALDKLVKIFDRDSDEPIETKAELAVPSVDELVDEEIRSFLTHNDLSKVKQISELESERRATTASSTLPTFQLREFAQRNTETLRAIKFSLPPQNALVSKALSAGISAIPAVSVQVYKTINNRETKLLEVTCPLDSTFFDLFRTITAVMPEARMFDGPQYADSGLFIVDGKMFTTGSEDYSQPFLTWLKQYDVSASVASMASQRIGELETLPSLVSESKCCFLLFCGSELLRIFFSNISFQQVTEPTITYKRKIPRFLRCLLCTTRVADLIVVNDEYLPKNPSHCCTGCYRRIRSDAAGDFVPPGDHVVLSAFSLI
jgi:hypothetical protein